MISKPTGRSTRRVGNLRADHNPTTAQVTVGETDRALNSYPQVC
jgi:hypothetical protein